MNRARAHANNNVLVELLQHGEVLGLLGTMFDVIAVFS